MSHITVRWMPEAKPPIPPIMIETLGSNYIISIAEAGREDGAEGES